MEYRLLLRRTLNTAWALVIRFSQQPTRAVQCNSLVEQEIPMPVLDEIERNHEEMVSWRRDLHAHPELGFAERRTSTFIQERLRFFGVDAVHSFNDTGVVAVIHGRDGDQAIGLRADIDALPIAEQSRLPYASTNPGVMHACGHDGHTTMLLGAARYLASSRKFRGTAYLIFQPAEEIGGAKKVVDGGLFDRFPMRLVFGMHNFPMMPQGEFYWRNGPIMAAANFFEITIVGRGAHAAQPHFGIDPIVAGSALVNALQTIVSRTLDPFRSGVVTIGSFQAGVAANAIPGEAVLKGTARWLDTATGETIERRIRQLADSIGQAYGATVDVAMHLVAPATINDEAATTLARKAAASVAGAEHVVELAEPVMGAEDFAYMLEAKQGAYIMLGTRRSGKDNPMLHHPAFDFNDAVLSTGAAYWATLVEQELALA
jgi:amidohydrolase